MDDEIRENEELMENSESAVTEASEPEVTEVETSEPEVAVAEVTKPDHIAEIADEFDYGPDEPEVTKPEQSVPSFDEWRRDEIRQRSAEPLSKPEQNKAALAAVAVLFILVVGLCIFIALKLSSAITFKPKKDVEYAPSDGSNPWDEIFGDKKADESETAKDDDKKDGDVPNFSEIFGSDAWKKAYKNHDRSEFSGEYYEEFVDSIDTSVSYKINREFDETYSQDYNFLIRTSYVQLEGDIPNLAEINRRLRDTAMFLADEYGSLSSGDVKMEADPTIVEVKSNVTYNDAETISVCVLGDLYLQAVNINLVTGTVLDNTQMISLPDKFGDEFKKRSDRQNGAIDALDKMSNEVIMQYLTDKNSMVVFYTPVGLELGFSYQADGYQGWVTISMKDYAKYAGGI